MDNQDIDLKLKIDDNLKNMKHYFKDYSPKFAEGISYSVPNFSDDKKSEFTYDEIQKMYPPFQSSSVNTCIVFWDDIIQFTALGGLDIFNKLVLNDDPETEFYVDDYFNRKNSLIEAEKFMYFALDRVYTLNQIERFYKKFYELILNASPFSGILPSIGTSIQMIQQVIFIFKHKVSDMFKKKLIEDLIKYWDISGRNKNIKIYSLDEINSEEEFYKYIRPSAIFTPNAADTLQALLKHDIQNVDIFVNATHNGLSPEFLDIYVYKLDMNVGPNRNKIYFYDDQIHIDDPEIFEEYQRNEKENNKK